MLADYLLQSNWLVSRKGKSWDGLILHGTIVGFMSLMALAPYIKIVWLPLLLLTAGHTLQDFLKVRSRAYLTIHSIIPYMSDQVLHYLAIIGIQWWVGDRISPKPSDFEIAFMWTGAAVIMVTRYFEVTWWANWLDMIPYMHRWRIFGYAERLSMLALSAVGLWFVAPTCIIPRLLVAHQRQYPIWRQRRGLWEVATGVLLSVVLGIGLHMVYAQL
jgi:hypothetical protein